MKIIITAIRKSAIKKMQRKIFMAHWKITQFKLALIKKTRKKLKCPKHSWKTSCVRQTFCSPLWQAMQNGLLKAHTTDSTISDMTCQLARRLDKGFVFSDDVEVDIHSPDVHDDLLRGQKRFGFGDAQTEVLDDEEGQNGAQRYCHEFRDEFCACCC